MAKYVGYHPESKSFTSIDGTMGNIIGNLKDVERAVGQLSALFPKERYEIYKLQKIQEYKAGEPKIASIEEHII